jgi:hypothetical protein
MPRAGSIRAAFCDELDETYTGPVDDRDGTLPQSAGVFGSVLIGDITTTNATVNRGRGVMVRKEVFKNVA